MALTITVKFLPETLKRLRQLEKTCPEAIARGLRGWAEQTRTAAIRVTPKDTGALRNSIFVNQDSNQVTIGAGGPAAPYAVHVHEKVDSKINWQTPGTGAKFIENPVVERMPKLAQDLSTELGKALQGK